MENVSSKENQEKIGKQRVLEMLQTSGFEHPETRDLVIKWTEQQEALVAKENTSRAAIIFEIERSDLYLAVGDKDGALECLGHARLLANQENEPELYDQIMKRMDEIEGQK